MCIIPWSPLKSLFEVITFWTGECWGMLWVFLVGCVLRASVACQGFALGSSPRWLFACSGSDRGRRLLGSRRVLSVFTGPACQSRGGRCDDVSQQVHP